MTIIEYDERLLQRSTTGAIAALVRRCYLMLQLDVTHAYL
jgi:hypothetical protein